MLGGTRPDARTQSCRCPPDVVTGRRFCHRRRRGQQQQNSTTLQLCSSACPEQFFCTARARFHLALAQLGKTTLSVEERQWLAPNDTIDGGMNLVNLDIPNRIFLYDQTELEHDYLWKGLADFLGVGPTIPFHREEHYHSSRGMAHEHDLCAERFDDYRTQQLLPYCCQLSHWLQTYFLPLAADPDRPDVMVANVDRLMEIVETYKVDPCLASRRKEE